MKMYRVKDEFIDNWTNECVLELIVSGAEIKRLANEWGVSESSLKEEVEPLERERLKVERFKIGEYYVDVEERVDPVHGLMWDAWICKGNCGTRVYMIGVLADQTKAFNPHTVSHDEALEQIFAQFDKDVEIFDDTVETLEDAMNEKFYNACN